MLSLFAWICSFLTEKIAGNRRKKDIKERKEK
jgi:hypothetical protein